MSDKLNITIDKMRDCLRIAVDTLIEISNTDTNQASNLRAKETIKEIKRILYFYCMFCIFHDNHVYVDGIHIY